MSVTLIVKEASYAQFLATVSNSFVEWGNGLTFEDYLEQEKVIAASEHAKDKLCYVLVPSNDPDGLEIRASCEKWPCPALYCPPQGKRAVFRPALGWFTLFTPIPYRGRGYAHLLIDILYKQLKCREAQWAPRDGHLSTLDPLVAVGFSDISAQFYEPFARACPALEVNWDVEDVLEADLASSPLRQNDFERIAKLDLSKLRVELPEMGCNSKHRFVIAPVASFYHVRTQQIIFSGARLGRKRPHIFGAEIRDGIGWSFAIWTMPWDFDYLLILRMRVSSRIHLATLIHAAQKEAKRLGFESVKAWNVCPTVLRHEKVVIRDSAIPEVCWLSPNATDEDVEWLHPEAYANTPPEY